MVASGQHRLRIGEHSAVVWKRLYSTPFSASVRIETGGIIRTFPACGFHPA
jgi:hypothetical protein